MCLFSTLINLIGFTEYCEKMNRINEIFLKDDYSVFRGEIMKSKEYFEAGQKSCLHQWAANYISKIKIMGCTTTQRAESVHGALKRKIISAQHLCVAFDRVQN